VSLCSFPMFSFAFTIPNPLPHLPNIDLSFTLAIPFPPPCPLD
jgi:hypothetical protein